jgi:hypothetical protein
MKAYRLFERKKSAKFFDIRGFEFITDEESDCAGMKGH